GLVQKLQTGSRTVTLGYSGTDLNTITNPDNGVHTFTNDANHKLTREDFATLRTTYAYSSGAASSYTVGDYSATTLNSAALFGLSALAPVVRPNTVDGLSRTTRWLMDTSGRISQQIAADGGVTKYTRDGNGWVTGIDDPVGAHTTIVLDTSGYPTTITLADGKT